MFYKTLAFSTRLEFDKNSNKHERERSTNDLARLYVDAVNFVTAFGIAFSVAEQEKEATLLTVTAVLILIKAIVPVKPASQFHTALTVGYSLNDFRGFMTLMVADIITVDTVITTTEKSELVNVLLYV